MLKHIVFLCAAIVGAFLLTSWSSGEEKGLQAVKPLLARFPHHAKAGPVTVYSDISKEFSEEHARHGEKVWAYFFKFFAETPGARTVLYYTRNQELYLAIARRTPFPNPLPNARMVTSLWDEDHRVWFIKPYQEPDFGTQLHELSHDFLYATYPGSADFPWFNEGTGMYWESGRWGNEGDLVVEKAVASYLQGFNAHRQAGELLPLRELVSLGRDKFWTSPYPSSKTYGQSMVLLHYLMKEHPKVMEDLFGQLNKAQIKDNDRLLQVLLTGLKMDLATLEKEYVEFGLKMQ